MHKEHIVYVSDSLKNKASQQDNSRDLKKEEVQEKRKLSFWQQYHETYINATSS